MTNSDALPIVKSEAAKVTVEKKGLTVTAKDRTITYGDAPNNGTFQKVSPKNYPEIMKLWKEKQSR